MIPKKEEASEEAAPETPKEKAGEVSLGQKVDVVPSENKENVYQAVFHRPAVEGGTLRVWTEGSDKKDVTYTNGKYVEEVPEGTTLYFEIEIKGNYLVDSVKDQNGAEIAPTNVSGNVSSYKMVIKENKELTIMYKEVPEEEEDEAEAEEETGLSRAPMARAAKAAANYTVKVGEKVTIKGHKNEECEYEHKWESSDPSIATVSSPGRTTTLTGKKAGTVTITHTYCKKDHEEGDHNLTTETFTVEVTGSETNPQPTGTQRVYIYMKMSSVPDGWKENNVGWFTIGYVDVEGIPAVTSGAGYQSGATFQAVKNAINGGAGVTRFTGRNQGGLVVDWDSIDWNTTVGEQQYGLHDAAGASDYDNDPLASGTTWHLDGYLEVKEPLDITITGNSKRASYNGSEQEVRGYTVNYPAGVNPSDMKVTYNGNDRAAGTDVGTYQMKLEVTKFSVRSDKYTVRITRVDDGWLEITPNTEKVIITINGNTKIETYDGTDKVARGYTVECPKDIAEDSVHVSLKDNVKAEATGRDAGTYQMGLTKDSFNVTVDNYSDVEVIVNDGSLTINPKEYTVTTGSATKEYDGTALTKKDGYKVEGIVEGETYTFEITGTQTNVGTSDNTYEIKWDGTATESNYTHGTDALGSLEVTAKSIETGTNVKVDDPKDKVYDGEAHQWEPTVKDGEKTLVKDTDYTVTYDTTDFTNVTGEITVTITGKGNYTGTVTKTYQITPATLTISTEGGTKTYDGTPLTNSENEVIGLVKDEKLDVTNTGTITEVGTTDNKYVINWNSGDTTAQERNYKVEDGSIGILEVIAAEYEVTVEPYVGTYDGKPHGIKVTAPEDATIEYLNENSYTDVTDGAVIVKYKITRKNYKEITGESTVTILPATLTISTEGGTKTYDGTPLTNPKNEVIGLVKNETLDVTNTGTITEVGKTDNEYVVNWKSENTTAKEKNYTVQKGTIGILEVTAKSIETGADINVNDPKDKVYDGEVHQWEPTVKDGEKTLVKDTDYTVTYDTTDFTNVTGEITVTITGKGNYTGTVTRTYKITRRPYTVTTGSATKKYDGTALTKKDGYKVEGIVDGETYTFRVTGSQIYVGTSENSYRIRWNGTAKRNNYRLQNEILGTLEVTDGTFIDPVDPDNVVTKTHDNKEYGLGDTITFTIKVANIYDEPKTITVVEQEGVTITGKSVFENVAPGATVETKATYKVTEKDILKGTFTNKVTAKFDGEKDYENTDTVEDLEDPKGHITVIKETTSTPKGANGYALGETITYKITAKNDGNITVNNVVVTDELTGDTWKIGSLEPNATHEVTAEYVVKEDDIHKGSVVNVATADGTTTDPKNPDPEVEDGKTTDETEDPAPNMSVNKTMTSTNTVYRVGNTITYRIDVANTGNVTLHNVKVTDNLQNAAGAVTFEEHEGVTFNGNEATIGSIAPGKTVTLNCSYVVTRADAGNRIINSAVGDSTETDPTDPSTTDPANVESIYNLTINYVYAAGGTAAPSVRAQYLAGESFIYTSPTIAGYTPNYTFVRTGADGMPARDVVITIIYTANPVTPVTPTTPTTPTTPGGGDGTAVTPAPAAAADGTPVGAEVALTEDGDVEVVPVVDEEVPLAKRDLDDHECCILHFLLMLAAMIVYAAYTRSMKKRQERIAELAEELETEKLKREQQEAAE